MGQRLVIALGGNAITRPDGPSDIPAQFAQTAASTRSLADLVEAGHELVITHGNGPQVGATYRRAELASAEVYPLPLETCVASTQGGMGFMIAQCMRNELATRGKSRCVTAIVTSVLVDPADPAFSDPSKPIGSYYSAEQARIRAAEGAVVRQVAPGRFRRVVPSPEPLRIVESQTIRRLVEAGELIVACGGGGVPVVNNGREGHEGVSAVVDKDRASALLAIEIDADRLVILTATEQVYVAFGTPDQRGLARMTVDEARTHLADGEFPPGSMGPKIEAAVMFIESSPKPAADVVICTPECVVAALAGSAGTTISR